MLVNVIRVVVCLVKTRAVVERAARERIEGDCERGGG